MKTLVEFIKESKKEQSRRLQTIGWIGNKVPDSFIPNLNRTLTYVLVEHKLVRNFNVTDAEREKLKDLMVDVYVDKKIIFTFSLGDDYHKWSKEFLDVLHKQPKVKDFYSWQVKYDEENNDIVGNIKVFITIDKKAKEKDLEEFNRLEDIRAGQISNSYGNGKYSGD